jgi:hypothetical protein
VALWRIRIGGGRSCRERTLIIVKNWKIEGRLRAEDFFRLQRIGRLAANVTAGL